VLFGWTVYFNIGVSVLIAIVFGIYTKSIGQPLFLILLLIMVPLAITELGTDSWITGLMEPEMKNIGLQAGWVLVYTSAIMFLLRTYAGALIHKMSPLGLLATCSAIAAVGLFLLSRSTGTMVLVAATIYGLGKSFFWPTMLGVVAERFPKGGALTLNITGGLGMIAAGVIGAGVLGFIQDSSIDKGIQKYDAKNSTTLSQSYVTEQRTSVFGEYKAIDQTKLANASEQDKATVTQVQNESKVEALQSVVIFPLIMLVSFILLIIYFRSKGGYKAVMLGHHEGT